jgi:outer membrane protein
MKLLSIPLLATITFAFVASPLPAFGQQIKIASVDMSKVFSEYYKTKKAEAELKDKQVGFEKEIRDKASELDKMREDAKKLQEDAENPAFTEEKKAEKRKTLQTKVNEGRLFAQQLQEMKMTRERDLKEQQNKERNKIVEEISKVIQDKAKRDGYTLVIDKAGLTLSGVSPFVFVQDSLDITSDIVKSLNASAPVGTAAVPATPEKKEKKEEKK